VVPGCTRHAWHERGLRVTGVDYSHNSIDYAAQYARQNNLDSYYRYQDYLMLEDEGQYDAALLIYGDFCPLSPGRVSSWEPFGQSGMPAPRM
jgi:hypothetical protein